VRTPLTTYLMAAAFFAAAMAFVADAPAQTSPPAEAASPEKPSWEKGLRHIMWRHRSCVRLGGFIWEVGTAEKVIARDFSLKGTPPQPDRPVAMGEVSALVFAAYAAQRTKGTFTDGQVDALTMRAGFTSPAARDCRDAVSIGACLDRIDGGGGPHGTFHYGPGHLQQLAVDFGLGSFSSGDMSDEYSSVLGAPAAHFRFTTLRLLDGLQMSPDNLSAFLRTLAAGAFRLSSQLGKHAVCLDPATCTGGVSYAPAPRNRDYGLGHWIEKNPYSGAPEAYSAAGKSGIYAWITADRKYYGYLIPEDSGVDRSLDGISCGRAMYRAVLRGAGAAAERP
jgi:hypothetical protein